MNRITLMMFVLFQWAESPLFAGSSYINEWNNLLTESMIADGISPVLASRMFVYPNIAYYECIRQLDTSLPSLAGRLNGLDSLPKFHSELNIYPELAAIQAFHMVARKVIYRESWCDSLFQKQLLDFTKGSSKLFSAEESSKYGSSIANSIIIWMSKDQYAQTKAKGNYLFSFEDEAWKPTPPEYREALEPFWGTLIPLITPLPPYFTRPPTILFSTDSTSKFFKSAISVYEISKKLSDEQREIALFWDDNPDLNTFYAHQMVSRRHINPASHWMSIIGQVCDKSNKSIPFTSFMYTLCSIALEDSKIACWYDKYKYNRVRPVTYIRKYIDKNWLPAIVTPPFPEHTSGHSACSMACATILTAYLGDNFEFTDTTLLDMGYKARKFTSFLQAANEVSDSRVLGGIHFQDAVNEGMEQGRLIANYILEKMR